MTQSQIQTYAEFSPTAHDAAGLGLPDRQDWLVAYSQHRDSALAKQANFASYIAELDLAGAAHETHRFGHWACGWIDVLIVAPAHAATVAALQGRLDAYPILDEDRLGELESEAMWGEWADITRHEVVDRIRTCFDLSELAYDVLQAATPEQLDALHRELGCGGDIYSEYSSSFDLSWIESADGLSRDRLAAFLRSIRSAARLSSDICR